MTTDPAPTLAVAALARPTFDVAYAEEMASGAFAALDSAGIKTVGPRTLLMDAEAALAVLDDARAADPVDGLLLLQVTFTDAANTVRLAEESSLPVALWAVPEPRLGGRLRLNAFCGLNLAAHALGRRGIPYSYLYAAPDADGIGKALRELVTGGRRATPLDLTPADAFLCPAGEAFVEGLQGIRIGRIGEHPEGFDTCDYDDDALDHLAGISVEPLPLTRLFETARAADDNALRFLQRDVWDTLDGVGDVDYEQLDKSLRLKLALDTIRDDGEFDAFAVRCWPETFTEYGGAVCGPVSMMGEKRVPCACEADVYGALTSLILQRIAESPAFLVDLVDLDAVDNTGVVWHCGQAPASMADPDTRPQATIHTNRRMPLLYEFALKPGRVTFARVSQARGRPALVIGGGEMLKRPMAFTGTSGVVRFDTPAGTVLDRVMGAGLEHHMALVYGEHRDALRAVSASLGLPLLEIA